MSIMKRKITTVVDVNIEEILSMRRDGYTLLSIKNHMEMKINQKISYSNFIKSVAKAEKKISTLKANSDISIKTDVVDQVINHAPINNGFKKSMRIDIDTNKFE